MRRLLFWSLAGVFAVPALLLTLVRLSGSERGLVVRVESFTPFAIPLYAVLVVLLASGALRGLGLLGVRLPRLVAAAAALGLLGLHGWWFAPQVVGSTPAAAPDAPRVVVMNANLFRGRGSPDEVVEAVRERGVDVLVLEEVIPYSLRRMDRLGVAELLPYRIGSAGPTVSGTVVLADRPLTDAVPLPTSLGGWQTTYDGTLTVLGVHPAAPTDADAWAADHRVVLQRAEEARADLVVGDLNATPDHDVLRRLRDAGFRDAAEVANEGWQPTWPANGEGVLPLLPPVVRIDHVLVGERLTALDTQTVDIGGSDHLAVLATVAARA